VIRHAANGVREIGNDAVDEQFRRNDSENALQDEPRGLPASVVARLGTK